MARFYLRSMAHARRVAQSVRSAFPALKLSQAQEWAAELLGYRDFHELQAITREQREPPSLLDEDEPGEAFATRRAAQAATLARLAGIDAATALPIVDTIAPTSRGPMIGKQESRKLFDEALLAALEGDAATTVHRIQTLRAADPKHPQLNGSYVRMLADTLALDNAPVGTWAPLVDLFPDDMPAHDYNLATDLQRSAITPEQHRAVSVRFDRVVANPKSSTALRSAALVNGAAAMRDGLLGDAPDWPGALARYEAAARLGNVVGKFNAGTVTTWIMNASHNTSKRNELASRAATWFQAVLDHAPHRDDINHVGEDGLEPLKRDAARRLADLRLNPELPTFQRAEGLRLLGPVTHDRSNAARHSRCQAASTMLSQLPPRLGLTPGELWRSALECVGWTFKAPTTRHVIDVRADELSLSFPVDVGYAQLDAGGRIPVVVPNVLCLPDGNQPSRLAMTTVSLVEHHLGLERPFILLPPIAVHQQQSAVFTGAYVAREDGDTALVSVSTHTAAPELLLEQQSIPFGSDPGYGGHDCRLPIAINLPLEGTDATPYLRLERDCPAALHTPNTDWAMACTDVDRLVGAISRNLSKTAHPAPAKKKPRGRRRKGYRAVVFLYVYPDHSTILPRVERGEIEPPRFCVPDVDFHALHHLIERAFPIPHARIRLANDFIDQVTLHLHCMEPGRQLLQPLADALLEVAAYSDDAVVDVRERWASERRVPVDPKQAPPITVVPVVVEGRDFEDTMIAVNQMQRWAGVKKAFNIFDTPTGSPEESVGTLPKNLRDFLAEATRVPYESTLLIGVESSDKPPAWAAR